jgi:hypothetical protein
MKKITLIIIGALLLIPIYLSDALGISIDSFREDVFRPENLPGGRETAAGAETKINEALQFAINLVLYAAGGVAVFVLVFAGIRYITSFGNQERMDAAKKTITYALIGLLAVILAYALVTNIINLIYRATT